MTKEDLERYLAEGLSLEQIGKRVGREKSTISYHVKKHGLNPVGVKYANKGRAFQESPGGHGQRRDFVERNGSSAR
jgi:IS30 family transposase